NSPRIDEGRRASFGAILGHTALPVAGNGGDDAGLHINGPNTAVFQVREIEAFLFGPKSHAIDTIEIRLGRGTAVAAESLFSSASEGPDDSALGDLAHAIVERVGDVDVAVDGKGEVVHGVEFGFEGGA